MWKLLMPCRWEHDPWRIFLMFLFLYKANEKQRQSQLFHKALLTSNFELSLIKKYVKHPDGAFYDKCTVKWKIHK